MLTSSLINKIKTYLPLLYKQTRISIGRVPQIGILPCDYKESNELPDASLFTPFDTDSMWGSGFDSHAWFHFIVDAHPECCAAPLILKAHSALGGWDADNPQFIAYVDGKLVQGLDVNHTEIFLDASVSHEIYIYGYTGPRINKTRFIAELYQYYPEVEKLWYDLNVPFESLNYLEPRSGEYQNIVKYLDDALNLVDFHKIPSEEFYASVIRASAFMDTEFYGKFCGQTESMPVTVCIGHTHIDCAWLWTLKQTREKVQRSFSTVVELMSRYPEYKFMSSQAFLYQNLKEEAPEVYNEVKRLIAEGRWECEGAMWVEADCNLASGESLVRQVMYGKRFFMQEFGVDNRVLWLPDVFGYSAALPQILKKCGVDWFVTSKISWNDQNQMPYDTFLWQGIDGTKINTFFLTAQEKKNTEWDRRFTTYVAHITPSFMRGTYDRFQQKMLSDETLITFGYGDGGGGPCAKDLEYARRLKYGIPGTPAAKIDFAGDFLKRLEDNIADNPRLPVWRGELYLEHHRGTYTTQVKNKKNNRRCEYLYQNTEWLSSIAKAMCSIPFPKAELHRGWEMILTNQFHDIIPGSSIHEVYEQCDIDYAEIRQIANKPYSQAQAAIAAGISSDNGYVVFNPNSAAADGTVLIDGKCAWVENIPSKGWACVKAPSFECDVAVDGRVLENKFYRLTFDSCMQLSSVYDKRADREVIREGGVGNALRYYVDYPNVHDAWEWCEYSLEQYDAITDVSGCDIVYDGTRAGIRITRRHLKSTISQIVWLYSELDRIDFETSVDWQEDHQMLKCAFDVDVNTDRASYEIQYGVIERPTHKNTTWDQMKFEVCAHKFADISEGAYGVTIMNDCKYGHDIHDGVMTISLLRAPTYPDETADRGISSFTYSLVPHSGAFDAAKASEMAYALNNPMFAVPASGKKSVLPERFSMVECDRANIVCEVVKEAEDSEATVVRLFENSNCKTTAIVKFGFDVKKAWLCDLMENELEPLEVIDGKVNVKFGAFEIQTIKVI